MQVLQVTPEVVNRAHFPLFQLVLAFTSVALVIGGRVVQHHSYFHPNVKSLLKTYHGAILMYAFAMGTAQVLIIETRNVDSD